MAQTVALLPPCLIVALVDPGKYLISLIVSLIVVLGWETLFAALRDRGFSLHGLTTVLITLVLFPADLPLWERALVLSLGVTLGELVFGGRGFSFLQPAVVAAALLVFSFPQTALALPTMAVALACLPGAVFLLVLGLISWRVIFSVLFCLVSGSTLTEQGVDLVSIGVATAFGIIFLISDPITAAATNAGRWIYGALAGGLIALFAGGFPITTEAVVFAALLASVFAPLVDRLVVLAHAWMRRRRLRHA